MLMQREVTMAGLRATQASGAVILVRFYVGLIFVVEGVLKYQRPEALGTGRFAKVDIPFPALMANLDQCLTSS